LVSFGVLSNAFSSSYTYGVEEGWSENGMYNEKGSDKSIIKLVFELLESQEHEEQNENEEDLSNDNFESSNSHFYNSFLEDSNVESICFSSRASILKNNHVTPKKYLVYHHLKIYC
jgi:hypothetical protein